MATAPPFSAPAAQALSRSDLPRPAVVRRRVIASFRDAGFAGAESALAAAIGPMGAAPATDCLVRHLLESARRLTLLAPGLIRAAGERGLPSPRWLLALLLRLHLRGLSAASRLDARARPLQERGIPILANDLPPIPLPAAMAQTPLSAQVE
jgi:hypothetical protein